MQSAVIPTAIPSVRLSVCPSVTRWYPIQTDEHRITRSSLWCSKNTLVFWYQQWLGGDVPFHQKFALKVTHPSEMRRLRPISANNISTVRASKKVQIGSRPRAFQRAIDEVRTLPLSPPKGGSKSNFVIFVNKNQFYRINSATKFLCVKTSSGKVVAESFPYLTVYICWG